ncbi:nucleoside-diphosphate kinase [Micromonospora sp. WMMA1363]|uniref:nucleoside-diphosphate kinase n=1 Tax=Micromonospora sp. WMMA1363 TaxID=3053985 RepID=UPI00259C879F|nr:nucleoside-diphosphate kinase [Micromonospora sp. WMMA1363]MDM4721999.1 nucleoside-diphosphate kinase [Micromonospora sp. WMMA1363]
MSGIAAYGPPFPEGLTHDPGKQRRHGTDSYFLEAYEQLSALTPDPVRFAYEHAMLLMKPDAVASRSIERATEWLSEKSFRIVAARRLHMRRETVRAIWHYQLNRATPQRCLLADALCGQSDSLVILLRPTEPVDVPATVALSIDKGPADPVRRRPGQLRTRLGDFGFLLNLVHASDEPADLVRELGILLEHRDRRALVGQALANTDRHDQTTTLARELYAEHPPHDLEFVASTRRLTRAVEELLATAALPDEVRQTLAAELASATDEPASWGPLVNMIWSADLPLTGWDFIVVGSHAVPLSHPQYGQLLAGADPGPWRALATVAAS